MTVRVVVAPEALEQAETIDEWWRTHRPAAPDLFAGELASALATLGEAPLIGPRVEYADDEVALRRLLLRSTRFHVYYALKDDTVRVVAVWSAIRGRGPDLKGLL